ncbi:MAG: esterase-like activity of phytase family protein [Hyphomicrobiaceae bacterium]
MCFGAVVGVVLSLIGVAPEAFAARAGLPAGVHTIEVRARPVPHFQASNPGRRRFGKLEYRGGLVLSSADSAFGGWSGLMIEPDGRRLMAVSDEGAWLSAELTYSGDAPSAVTDALIGPLVALKGRSLDRKRDLDAESITRLSGTLDRGSVLISFERNHRIGVFPVVDRVLEAPVRYLKLPAEARRMRPNKGLEAVAVLRGGPFRGSVVAFSERYPGPTARHTGWIWVKDTPHRITLADHGGFEITDAVSLEDGTLIVLERRFRWTEGVKMRLRRLSASSVKPGADLDGEILLEADLSSQIDNMEGLAAHRAPGGETVLTLISDNNFNPILQRNLLLQFTLPGQNTAAKGP